MLLFFLAGKRSGGGIMSSILIIDDEEQICEILSDCFNLEGFKVTVANDVKSAKQILNSEQFDIIVSDVRMPDGNGTEILTMIREKNIPSIVIMMSGYSSISEEEIYELGADAFFAKPFSIFDLLNKVKELL